MCTKIWNNGGNKTLKCAENKCYRIDVTIRLCPDEKKVIFPHVDLWLMFSVSFIIHGGMAEK